MSATGATSSTVINNPILQQETASTAGPSSGSWTEFASNISGEWDGHGADFTINGNPIELPENVIPNAYQEWEVKVFDWQTQCPTLANPETTSAMYKLIKLLPTVDCEADCPKRYTVEERTIGGPKNMVSAFAYQSSGSYVAVWSDKEGGFELEHCLIDPRDKESRVRIVQILGDEENGKLVLKSIRVFVEKWYGPFRNGDLLGGYTIRDSAFATTQALGVSDVLGVWQRSNYVANFQDSPNSVLQELIPVDGVENSVREKEQHMVLLPKNLWSSITETEDGDKSSCEVGWLLEPGCAITSKCIFSRNTELKEIITSSETAKLGV